MGGCGLVTRIILGGVCDIINVRLEEKEPERVLETRAEREREREREKGKIVVLHEN
jgi:hypothetical protein